MGSQIPHYSQQIRLINLVSLDAVLPQIDDFLVRLRRKGALQDMDIDDKVLHRSRLIERRFSCERCIVVVKGVTLCVSVIRNGR